MVLRVKPSPYRLPTNNFFTPVDNTPLHSIPSVCHPWSGACGGTAVRRPSAIESVQLAQAHIPNGLTFPTMASFIYACTDVLPVLNV